MTGWLRKALVAGWLATALAGVAAQAIYTCVDAQGRRHTSDRLIPECTDREQKVFGRGGTVRKTVPALLSPLEEAAKAQRERQAAEEKQRQADERRADRALLARYPNRALHEQERARALQFAQQVEPASQREEEIRRLHARFDDELARLRPLWSQAHGGAARDEAATAARQERPGS